MTSLKNKRIVYLRYIMLLFIVGTLSACDKQIVYHAFQPIPKKGWLKQDTLLFETNISDSLTHYKLFVEVRNRSNYPYQNINLAIYYDSPSTEMLFVDTLKGTLATKSGVWKGSGWGGLYQSEFPIGDIKIESAGNYRFKVVHILPDKALPGISDIGIKLERQE